MRFGIEKSTVVNAPVSKVRSYVDDFRQWRQWSPWTIVEPECTVEVQGSPRQNGHSMRWDGQIIGSGKNTLRSSDDRSLNYDLEFLKPWKSQAQTSFHFEETNGGTRVTWTMDSSLPFFLFFMVKLMKNWVGMDYDRGLRMLKEVAENGKIDFQTTNAGIVDYQGFSYVGIQRTVDFSEMPAHMSKDFERLAKEVRQTKKKSAKHWVCIYPKFDMKNMKATYIAAVSDEELQGENMPEDYVKGKIAGGRSLEIKHNGSYDFLGNAWSMGMMFVRAKKLKSKGFPFEEYWNSPYEVSPRELKTSIFFPLK